MAKSIRIRILIILVFSGFGVFTTAGASAQTGQPYYNVMSSPYNATCNGNAASDDTGAIQHALNDAKAVGGGSVLIPRTPGACVIQGSLNLDNFSGVSLTGPPAGNTGLGSSPNPILRFKAASGTLISMKSTFGVSLKNLTLQYDNPNFAGTFIDLSHSATGIDSDMDYIADCTIQGSSTARGADPLVYLDKAIDVTIERNIFEWAVNGVTGQANNGGYSNGIRVRDNLFSGYDTDSISGNMILNLGTGWIIEGNTFEMGGTAAFFPIPINGNTVGCTGCQINGNWIGDTHAGYGNSLITGTYKGTSISGNYISGLQSTGAVGITLGPSSSGLSVTGNHFDALYSAFQFLGSSQSNILIAGNQYVVNSFSIGTPASGLVTDNTGQSLVYGPSQFTGQAIFDGDVYILGNLTKGAGAFKIDHPLDAANKYLSHSFVESPDMMNIYNGIATLDSRGRALVTLPAYFEALNQDFRYQLTCIGGAAAVYVAREVHDNNFLIAGGKPGLKVSWQVTGVRHDAYANAHRVIVEEEKPMQERGRYLYPSLFGHPASDAIRFPSKPFEAEPNSDESGHK